MDIELPFFLGRVTYIIDLDYFYMHIGTETQLEAFSKLEEEIANFTTSVSTIDSLNDIYENQMVLVNCTETYGCWRRGIITRIDLNSNSADVNYIDYGETENIKEERICCELMEEFEMFPPQALRCCIAGIRPIAKNWTTRAAKIFEQHTQIKIFNTVVLDTENGVFKVALYSRDGDQRCLSSILMDEELGFPVEEEFTEYFGDAAEFYTKLFAKRTQDAYDASTGMQSYGQDMEFTDNYAVIDNMYTDDNGDSYYSAVTNTIRPTEDHSQPAKPQNSTSNSMLLNFTAAIEISKKASQDNNNSNKSFNSENSRNVDPTPLSPEIIPQFNFDSLQKTHRTTTDKLLEKGYKQTQEALQEENERVKLDIQEQAKLAVAAGYGGFEDFSSKELQKEEDKKSLKELSPPPIDKRNTPHGRELLRILNQIFIDSERDPVDEIQVRLRSLFGTDSYLFLNKEEMSDLMNTVMNRAVRYYGLVHDVILEILEILSGTQHFQECLLEAVKKVQDMYIKIQYKGKPFHVQCSKILGHLFNMSLNWNNSYSLQEYITSLLQKWIMFNKKAKQIGTDTLQEIYLECFETIWEVSGDALLTTDETVKPRLLKECQDKILNTDISKNIRSQTLHIYTLLNMKQRVKVLMEQEAQTESLTADVGCQTEPEYKGETMSNSDAKYQRSKPPFYLPKTSKYYEKSSSRCSTPSSYQDNSEKLDSEDSWPALPKCQNVLEIKRTSSPALEGGIVSPILTGDRNTQSPADPLVLLTPASFSESLHSESSSQNSSIYYSMKENLNNSAPSNMEEMLKDNEKPPLQKETSPLQTLIAKDATARFDNFNDNKNEHFDNSLHKFMPVSIEARTRSKQKKVLDWWNPETEEIDQKKVKDHWDVSESDDTSETTSVRSDIPKSLDDVSSWMLKTVKTPPLAASPILLSTNRKDSESSNKEKDQIESKSDSCSVGHSQSAKKTSTTYRDTNFNEMAQEKKTGIDWWDCDKKDSAEKPTSSNQISDKNADENSCGVDEDDDDYDDGEWDTYSTDDTSLALDSDCFANELPMDEPTTKENVKPVSIIREYSPVEKPKPSWKPMGSRKCTICGDSTHVIYNCPDKNNKGLFY